MPSDRRCIWVRLSSETESLIDVQAQKFGVSRSALVSALVEANLTQVSELAQKLNVTGSRRVLSVANAGQKSGFQVAVTSTTATNSPSGTNSTQKDSFCSSFTGSDFSQNRGQI